MLFNQNGKKANRILLSALFTLMAVLNTSAPALCSDGAEQKELLPVYLSTVHPQSNFVSTSPEILLVMPNSKAEPNETAAILKEAHVTIIGTIGQGDMTCLLLQTKKGEFEETEKKLTGDNKHFTAVQRNFISQNHGFSRLGPPIPNDPYFGSQWHLAAMNIATAWNTSTGRGATLGVADTGCQGSNPDLQGKTFAGFDVISGTARGNVDVSPTLSHGTLVATTAAATTANKLLTASPARDAYIYPIRIADANGSTDDSKMIGAILNAGTHGIRVLNISYGVTNTRYSLANAQYHPVLHAYLKWYHDQRNGLTFFSAGNSAQRDASPRVPYLIMVSAINAGYKLASFSNYGSPIWFTAPGQDIYASNLNGRVAKVDGTSFASPLVASIATMVISHKPGLTNTQVEQILIRSCGKPSWNQAYGYGMPDAAIAVKL